MTAMLKIIEPGLQTTVQDLGRTGYQRFGIPVSGALDNVALRVANAIVGNRPDEAALEVLFTGPTLEVHADSVRVAVASDGAAIEVHGRPARRIDGLRSVVLERGQIFHVTAGKGGQAAYLAIEGGLALPAIMGSRSTYQRAGIGGFNGRALQAGDELMLARSGSEPRTEAMLRMFPLVRPERVRVVLGPQDDYFSAQALKLFLTEQYTVTRDADRMGLRLDGPELTHIKGHDIVSDGIAPGAIQVPGNGLPIMLRADRQTTGGYPKIATVISADLASIGRLGPGNTFRFAAISVDEATEARRALETEVAAVHTQLMVPPDDIILDESRLYSANLIDGVVSAGDWNTN